MKTNSPEHHVNGFTSDVLFVYKSALANSTNRGFNETLSCLCCTFNAIYLIQVKVLIGSHVHRSGCAHILFKMSEKYEHIRNVLKLPIFNQTNL